jgi:hypothetical protein
MSRMLGFALLLAVIATPFLGREVVAQDATPCPPLTEEEAVAFATTYFNGWNAHDSAAIAALHTPGIVHHWGIGFDTEGIDELIGGIDGLLAAFPSAHWTVDQVWLAGDTVIVRYIVIGVQETEYMGVPASQDTVTWTGIQVMRLECGMVAEAWGEADHFGRLEQMGLIPIAPEAEATPAG